MVLLLDLGHSGPLTEILILSSGLPIAMFVPSDPSQSYLIGPNPAQIEPISFSPYLPTFLVLEMRFMNLRLVDCHVLPWRLKNIELFYRTRKIKQARRKKSEARNGGNMLPDSPTTFNFLILVLFQAFSIHVFGCHETFLGLKYFK